jgi:hypothetical protein
MFSTLNSNSNNNNNDSMRVLDFLLDFSIKNETNKFEINEFLEYAKNCVTHLKMLCESIEGTNNFFQIIGSKIQISTQVRMI